MITSNFFRKNFEWGAFSAASKSDLKGVVRDCVGQFLLRPSADVNNALRLFRHAEQGAQLWVSRQVSDDLLASHADPPDFADIVWPSDSLEVYFEDEDLCTILLTDETNNQLFKWCCEVGQTQFVTLNEFTPLVHVLTEDIPKTGSAFSFAAFKTEDVKRFCAGDLKLPGEGLAEEEDAALRFMVGLSLKVLLLAGVEGFRPERTLEQPSKREGGKAGFKGRPKRPRFVVKYLPRHLEERRRQAAEAQRDAAKRGKVFRGRNGHLRTYRADRYVHMKGKSQFIFPVPGPDGRLPKRQFRVVRKPSTTTPSDG